MLTLVNVADYGIPQDRKHVFYIDFRKDLEIDFRFLKPNKIKRTLKDAIWDLRDTAVPALESNYANPDVTFSNHEYFLGSYSTIFISRNEIELDSGMNAVLLFRREEDNLSFIHKFQLCR